LVISYAGIVIKHVIEGKIEGGSEETEVTERQGRRDKQLLDDITGTRRY
jgi:hypothetical protein